MKQQTVSNNGLRSFAGWLQEIGVSDVTGWRWKKRKWFTTRNISGRIYIEQAEIDRFLERVRDGEFAKTVTVPLNGGSDGSPRGSQQGNHNEQVSRKAKEVDHEA